MHDDTVANERTPSSRTCVGFVGLGAMGSAMASHLVDHGWAVVGFDPDESARVSAAQVGVVLCDSLAELRQQVDIAFTSLPHAAALRDVIDATAGEGGSRRFVLVDTSTLDLEDKMDARRRAEAGGTTLVDCPVSGTSAQARQGDLVAYLSGADGDTRVTRLLADIVRRVHDVGGFGNGTRTKLVANHLVAIHNVAAAEALVLAQRVGLDVHQVLETVGDGAGSSRMFQVRGPLMVEGAYEPPTAAVQLFLKDLDAISRLATTVSSPTPLLTAARTLYEIALKTGRGQQDTACVHAVLTEMADAARAPVRD